MPEFFLELFSEEIPARMQARAAADLVNQLGTALLPLRLPHSAFSPLAFSGPRRIAVALTIADKTPTREIAERGPRRGAPEAALAGFLRKHGAPREALAEEGDYWVLRRTIPGQSAAALIAEMLPPLLWRFPWSKSMRWGGKSQFTWVRPLRRILAVLDGEVVKFDLRQGEDDAHGLASGNETEGHRFLAPGAFTVRNVEDWQNKLRDRRVIADFAERRGAIAKGIADVARAQNLSVVADDGLLDEVTGLVEWPVALIGRIDDRFMDLPPEVRQVSMRVNQRYFACQDAARQPAPAFAFVANITADDGGAAIIAGNERVLRARLSDARHFYDLDRRVRLESRVESLKEVIFHAKLGTQYDRAKRLERLARYIAPLVRANTDMAARAGLLAKADLTTFMVGEFPELQGVMGYYYALHDREPDHVALAIRDHYLPRDASDDLPSEKVSMAVALADKIDQLAGFFAIDEKPTGSGDPYALRRAALGIIQIIRIRDLKAIRLRTLFAVAAKGLGRAVPIEDIVAFVIERLRVLLRAEGRRHDILAAVFAASADDDIMLLMERSHSLSTFLTSENSANLLVAYRRAANILRIEDKKDGPHAEKPDPSSFTLPEEHALYEALATAHRDIEPAMLGEDFAAVVGAMAQLRAPVDAFFDKVTVNDPNPDLRRNRLRLLSRIRDTMNRFADFSLIEG